MGSGLFVEEMELAENNGRDLVSRVHFVCSNPANLAQMLTYAQEQGQAEGLNLW